MSANPNVLVVLALAGSFTLSGCANLWPTRWNPDWPAHKTPPMDLPTTVVMTPLSIDRQWWKAFADPALDRLVDEALANNLDLARAAANVAEARASTNAAKALLKPRVDALGKASTTQRQVSLGSSAGDVNSLTGSGAAGIGIGWEIDLWGRIRQLNEAALARLAASEHTRNATALSISSAVVDTYFQLLALDVNLLVIQDAQRNLAEVAELELRRWKAQVGTELAYSQSLAELASTEARIPGVEAAIARTELALSILVGRSPRQMTEPLVRTRTLPTLPDMPREFDTALLLRRPDVASAEQMLAASHADVNAARAEQHPRLNLSLLAGLLATTSSAITGFPLYADLSAGVSAPIYDAGLLRSKVEAAEARKQNAIAHYRYTVSVAFRDVYAAMVEREAGDQQVMSAQKAVAIRKQSLVLAEKSYEAGRTSKFEVLSETIQILNAQTALTDARLNQFIARSQFYKAIGGGF